MGEMMRLGLTVKRPSLHLAPLSKRTLYVFLSALGKQKK